MDAKGITDAINSTGFPLENRTATAFKKSGWSIFPNKYYLDDTSGEPREIDLIAYKFKSVDDLKIYSAIIVSCKKSAKSKWAFLSRNQPVNDPNKDLSPLHYWTNDPVLAYCADQDGFSHSLTALLGKVAPDIWGIPGREIFAFQEISFQMVSAQKGKGGATKAEAMFLSHTRRITIKIFIQASIRL